MKGRHSKSLAVYLANQTGSGGQDCLKVGRTAYLQTVVLCVRPLAAARAGAAAAAAALLGQSRQEPASQSVHTASTDWRVGLPKLEWMALTACRRPGAAWPGGQPRLILGPGPVGRGRQGPASLSVHPAGRTGGADCLTACRQAGRLQARLYIFYFWNSTKIHLGP